jgi:hypothetical protein
MLHIEPLQNILSFNIFLRLKTKEVFNNISDKV